MEKLVQIWHRGANGFVKILVAFAAILLFIPQTAQAIERKFLVASFDDIEILGDVQVDIITGKSTSAKASGDKYLLDAVKFDRAGGTLRIRLIDPTNNSLRRTVKEPLRITITNRHVRNITLRSNARLNITEVKQSSTSRILMIGSGSIDIAKMQVDALTATLVGNGTLKIGGGTARSTILELEGAPTVDASLFKTKQLRLGQSGTGSSSIDVAEQADINNNGAGKITINGKGTCSIRRAGSATINCPNSAPGNGAGGQ